MKLTQILLILAFAFCVEAARTHVQTNDTASDGSSTTISVYTDNACSAGNVLVVGVEGWTGSSCNITMADSLSNVWIKIDTFYDYNNSNSNFAIYYCKGCVSGKTKVTATYSSEMAYRRIAVTEYSGIDTAFFVVDTFTKWNQNIDAGTDALFSPKVKPSNDSCLAYAFIMEAGFNPNAGVTAGTGFALRARTAISYKADWEDSLVVLSSDSIRATFSATSGDGYYGGMFVIFNDSGYVPPEEFTFIEPDSNRVYQRMTTDGQPGGNSCSLTVSGNCKPGTESVNALILHGNDTIVNWTTIEESPTTTYSGKVSIPTGGWYTVKVADNLGDTISSDNRFSVGDLWLVYGQSLIMGWLTPKNASRDTASDSVVDFTTMAWKRLVDPICPGHGASPFIKLGNMLVEKTGYPHGFMNYAKGGTTIGSLKIRNQNLDDTTYNYNKAVFKTKLAGGKIRGIIFGQGESDAETGESKTDYMNIFDSLFNNFEMDLEIDNIPVFYDMIGRLGGIYATKSQVAVIQDAQLSLENHNKKYFLITPLWDLPISTADSAHILLYGNDTLGTRFGKKISKWYDGDIDSLSKVLSISSFQDSNLVVTITCNGNIANIEQIPSIIIKTKEGDTLPSGSIYVSGNLIYDTIDTQITSDSIYMYYADNYWPDTDYVVKDTFGFPLPQVFYPLGDDVDYIPVLDTIYNNVLRQADNWQAFRLYDTINIEGVNFGDSGATSAIYINSTGSILADLVSWTPTKVRGIIPYGTPRGYYRARVRRNDGVITTNPTKNNMKVIIGSRL